MREAVCLALCEYGVLFLQKDILDSVPVFCGRGKSILLFLFIAIDKTYVLVYNGEVGRRRGEIQAGSPQGVKQISQGAGWAAVRQASAAAGKEIRYEESSVGRRIFFVGNFGRDVRAHRGACIDQSAGQYQDAVPGVL